MRSFGCLALTTSVMAALGGFADAHVAISSGPAGANKTQIITLDVGHGCEDAAAKHLDTIKVRVTIPAGVTSVRALFSDFGKPALLRSGTTVTHVEWTKPVAALLDGDDGYYQLRFRARIPDVAFTKLKFDVQQTCEDATTHAQVVVDWNAAEGSPDSPAPHLTVVPAHGAGWTQITVPRAVTQDELPVYLGDAQIVWRGTAAYSSNAATAALIAATPGVTVLAGGLAAGDVLWVKY